MNTESFKHTELTDKIIRAFYTVYNKLGYGFLEKVYENAMRIELRKLGLHTEKQVAINVYYNGEDVGIYFADLIVENLVIIELKAGDGLVEEHEAQLTNYLRATTIEVGLLLNFGKMPQVKRKAFSNEYKTTSNVQS
jgi:GxxExxY protein